MEEYYNNNQSDQGDTQDSPEQKPTRPIQWEAKEGGMGRVLVSRRGDCGDKLRRSFVMDADAYDELSNATIGNVSIGSSALISYAVHKLKEEGVDLIVT